MSGIQIDYDSVAEIYDLFVVADYDIPFFLHETASVEGPVLELTAGTGRLSNEVQARSGSWFLLQIRPYRTLENVIEGAVITFFDITEMKRLRAQVREAEELRNLALVARDARDAMTVQDLTGRILAWNRGATALYGWSESEAIGMNVRDLTPDRPSAGPPSELIGLATDGVLRSRSVKRLTKEGRELDILLTATALVDESGEMYAIATTERELRADEKTADGNGER